MYLKWFALQNSDDINVVVLNTKPYLMLFLSTNKKRDVNDRLKAKRIILCYLHGKNFGSFLILCYQ